MRWSTPLRIFVNSTSDIYHERVPDRYITQVAEVMKQADWHTFQVLTRPPVPMVALLLGRLRAAPAQVRTLSIEPLLEGLALLALTAIHWVIEGGDSGPRARPTHTDWGML